MSRQWWLLFPWLFALMMPAVALGDPQDAPGTSDPPLVSRMPGYHIYRSERLDFDRLEVRVAANKTEVVEGQLTMVIYSPNEGITQPSGLQIARNYANAIKAIGGSQVYGYEDGGYQLVTLRAKRDNVEFWVAVEAAPHQYTVRIIEKKAMSQDVVASAAALSSGLRETGRAVVPGIFFDTAKAAIKPESEAALAQILKLLAAEPKLKVYVVGHTDNVGAFDANQKLSKDRAESVVRALTAKGVSATRLRGYGVGPLAPVAANSDEAGRAKNRRVELVAQ